MQSIGGNDTNLSTLSGRRRKRTQPDDQKSNKVARSSNHRHPQSEQREEELSADEFSRKMNEQAERRYEALCTQERELLEELSARRKAWKSSDAERREMQEANERVLEEVRNCTTSGNHLEKVCQTLVTSYKNEADRWRGDREETSKELQDKYDQLQKEHNSKMSLLNNCYLQNGKLSEELEQLKKDTSENFAAVKHDHKNEIEELQRDHSSAIMKLRTENGIAVMQLRTENNARVVKLESEKRDLQIQLDTIRSEHEQRIKDLSRQLQESGDQFEYNDKGFNSKLAKVESKALQERIVVENELKRSKDEVSHWNTEAVRLSKQLKHVHRWMKERDITFADADQSSLRKHSGNSGHQEMSKEIEELRRKTKMLEEELATARAQSSSPAPQSDAAKQVEIHRELFNTIITQVSGNKFNCRCVSHLQHRMIEFEVERFPAKEEYVYQHLRIMLAKSQHGQEGPFKGRKTLQYKALPRFMKEILALVHTPEAEIDPQQSAAPYTHPSV